jgi:hypothetical protein
MPVPLPSYNLRTSNQHSRSSRGHRLISYTIDFGEVPERSLKGRTRVKSLHLARSHCRQTLNP